MSAYSYSELYYDNDGNTVDPSEFLNDAVGDAEVNIDEILGGSLFEYLLSEIRGGNEDVDADSDSIKYMNDSSSESSFLQSDEEYNGALEPNIGGDGDDHELVMDDFINGGDDEYVTQQRSAIIDFDPEEEAQVLIIESTKSNVDEKKQEKLIALEDEIDPFKTDIDIIPAAETGESRPDNLSVTGGLHDDGFMTIDGAGTDNSFSTLAQSIAFKFLG